MSPGLTTNRANQTTPRDSNFAFNVSCSPHPAARYRPLSSLYNRWSGCRRQRPIDSRQPDCRKPPSSTFDENSRSHRCCMGLRPLQRFPRTAVLESEGCRPQFQQDCGPAECQHCRAGCQPSASHACVAYLVIGYWRLPPRPRLR